ncbi:MAG: PQQ-binding-like beta-propeller repeat protein [Planctomycetes bacterium]|nr:PQQ-binding-like beta-propeller repeat protein [Planctomycetota bacterium]
MIQPLSFASIAFAVLALGAPPRFVEDRFEVPPGFRVYKAAGPELTGGSYDIALDGKGRLLVGDGTQVRRLEDSDGDAVFDAFEVVAEGLGPRGPQGLLVWGRRLYAVGGDGVQLFEEEDGRYVHRGRLGRRFSTGGDHDAHAVLRGHDGHIYFITGDGGGTRERVHITEETSPALFERSCSVFRFSPDGSRWECFATGGRNAPNLGMSRLGELFSLDSDMEWHVEMPWWRPVRLHHWTAGGDQGWQDVGAYPPYYVDNLPGILDVGRGSPDWGVFYESSQLPERYRDAYLVCDYLTKSATTGGYEASGRLFAFFLERSGAGWKASMEVLARPKPGAKDAGGHPIGFALVDIEVAPDGSLLLSDHGQGVWRIVHDPRGELTAAGAPPLFPPWPPLPEGRERLLAALLALPQPGSEWSRLREEEIRAKLGDRAEPSLRDAALDRSRPLEDRLRAVRLCLPGFSELPEAFVAALAADPAPELRAQAAWILGLRGARGSGSPLERLIDDPDPFVRRRALEAIVRSPDPALRRQVISRLEDPVRLVRYVAMTALSHLPRETWFAEAVARDATQARIRALVAADLRREPPPDEEVRRVAGLLLDRASPGDSKEDRLDLLRVLGRFRRALQGDEATLRRVEGFLLAAFPDPDRDVRWELARLLGEHRAGAAFGRILAELEREMDPVTQFHLAQALSRLPSGWSAEEEDRAVRWVLGTQRGWFADLAGKGLQFREFWATVLAELGERHRGAFLRRLGEIDLSSPLGGVLIELVASSPDAAAQLAALHRRAGSPDAARRILGALGGVRDPRAAAFLRDEYLRLSDPELRGAALRALARQGAEPDNEEVLAEGLLHPDGDVVHAVARILAQVYARFEIEPKPRVLDAALGRYLDRSDLFRPLERLLMASTGARRPDFDPETEGEGGRRPRDAEVEAGRAFWKGWYATRFGRDFDPGSVGAVPERSDEEVHAFLLAEAWRGGDAARGRKVFEAARCASCHGGEGFEGGRIFGPELAGVTRRLARAEISDALVYPSKVVADRFRGVLLQTSSGEPHAGFVTEETAEAITLAGQETVRRLAPSDVVLRAPLETSLMPERLLNRRTLEELRDLAAFLEELGSRPDPAVSPAISAASPAEWSVWRGPGGRGVAAGPAPERWSVDDGVLWTARLTGWGNSSPVVSSGRLHITAQTDDDALHAVSIDAATGKVLWDRVVGSGRLKAHQLHNMATPTPAAEGDRAWFLFGTGDLSCLDAAGEVVWRRNLARDHGEYRILWGMGSSPMLGGDLLYLCCQHPGPSYVLAVDKRTGKDVWKTERNLPCEGEATDSYSSPVLLEAAGRLELIVSGADHVTAYDPVTGKGLWISSGLKIDHPYGRTMASPGAGEGMVVACSASVQGLGKMIAVEAGGEGDVSATRKRWQYDKVTPDCPTPLVYEGHAYGVRDDGIASCLDLKTGELRWRRRLQGDFKASPVAAAGRVYFLSTDGDCTVMRAGPKEDVVAESHLDGHFIATPALARGRIYLRSKDSVYAVGKEENP